MTFTLYITRRFLRLLFFMVIATLLVYVLLDFVGNIRIWLLRTPQEIFEYYLNYAPQIIYLVMPVNLLLAVVGTVGGMARHLEITSMKIAGHSVLRISSPIILLGVIVSLLMFWMTEKILPDANHRRLELAQPPSDQASKIQRDKFKLKSVVVGQDATFYLRNYSAKQQRAREVVILKFDSSRVTDRWDARIMEWRDSSWILRDGFHRRFFVDGESSGDSFVTADLHGVISEKPSDFLDDRFSPDEMDRKMILQKIESQRRSGESTRSLETHYHFKLAGSCSGFLIVLIGISLSHGAIRGGIARIFGIGLLLTFSYYVLLRMGLVLGENGALSPLMGAWFGNVIAGTVALILLLRSIRL